MKATAAKGAAICIERETCRTRFKPHAPPPPAPAIARPIASRVQLSAGAHGRKLAVVHDGDAVAERQHLVEVVGDQQHRGAGVARREQAACT